MSARRPRSEALRQEWRARFASALVGLVPESDLEDELAAPAPELEPRDVEVWAAEVERRRGRPETKEERSAREAKEKAATLPRRMNRWWTRRKVRR